MGGGRSKVWTQPDLPLRGPFLDVLAGDYGSPLAEADFAADPDAQRAVINQWVAERTEDRIEELLPEDALTAETAPGPRQRHRTRRPVGFPFDPAATADQPFTRTDGSTVQRAHHALRRVPGVGNHR